MCFSIPRKVLEVKNGTALIDTNEVVTLGAEITVKQGDYVQIIGNIVVAKLSATQGLKIRKLIKDLNTYYDE